MKTTMIKFISMLSLTVFALSFQVGCGGKKKTNTPQDVKSSGATNADNLITAAVVKQKVKPKRALSKDAKKEFRALVDRYQKAVKSNRKLTDSDCESLASDFESLYEKAPKMVEAKFNQGAAFLQCGKTNKAEKVFQQIISKHGNHGGSLNNLGMIAYSRGQMSTAADYFQKAARATSSGGYANLALLDRKKALNSDRAALKAAVDNIHRSLAVDSSTIGAYEMLATIVYDHAKNMSQLEMARLITLQGIKLDSEYAPLYNIMGLILLKMNEVTRALKQFRKAAALDATLLEAHMNIAAITLSFRDYRSAENAFNAVLNSPKVKKSMKMDATIGLGVAYRGQRKFKEAMAQYEKVKAMDSKNYGVEYNMGILIQDYFFDAGNPEAAITTLKKARRHLNTYVNSPGRKKRLKDAKRRIKNITEMIPMLREQIKMMAEMKKMQEAEKAPKK